MIIEFTLTPNKTDELVVPIFENGLHVGKDISLGVAPRRDWFVPLSSKYVLEGAEKPEYLTILKETISADSGLPSIVADRIADNGVKNVGILGL